jgi:hypothetical protein
MYRFVTIVAAAVVLGVLAGVEPLPAAEVEAEEEGYSANSVARLKVFEGTAWVRTPDSGEWEEYSTNTPVPERARVNVPEGSEAELQFHGGQFVLLTGGTEVEVRKFDDQGTTFRMRSGELRFDLPADDFAPVKVGVPGGGNVQVSVPGRYWLSIPEGGEPLFVVRSGEGLVAVAKGERRVKPGEEAVIGEEVLVRPHAGPAEEREPLSAVLTEEETKAGVPPATAHELREYGEWVQSGEYGWVWRPRVATGWTPYYYGRWVWVSPYGWTWVSNEPWGWYPYHFGWWAADPVFGWIWCPIRVFTSASFVFEFGTFRHFHRHAFFYPATVRFVRDGRVVRWQPLRPGERFRRPTYTRSDARLGRWERPLARGSVFVRETGREGRGEWREWSAASRDRKGGLVRNRGVVVREVPRGEGKVRGDGSIRRRTDGPAKPPNVGKERRGAPGKIIRPESGSVRPPSRDRDRPAAAAPVEKTRPSRVERPERVTESPPGVSRPAARERAVDRGEPSVGRGEGRSSDEGGRDGSERGGGHRPDFGGGGRGERGNGGGRR